ncbi:MAG TPA: zf-HC2 domain-containing protein [Solirubrobacterales bacterium]
MGESSKLDSRAAGFYGLIFERARRGCLRELRGLGCAEEEAEELFMATTLTVMLKVDPIARDFAPAQMVNLLKISSRRRLFDTRRHQRVIKEVALERAAQLDDPSAESPEESAQGRHAIAVAREALLFLPRRDRLIYFLRFQMSLSPAEVRAIVPGLGMRKYRNSIERSTPRARAAFERIESGRRCNEIAPLVTRRIAKELGAEEGRLLTAHLDHCRHCQRACAG